MALNLFGVTVNDAHTTHVDVADTEMIAVRDIAAICGRAEYRDAEPGDSAVARLSDVVTAFALRGPVLPAPVGVVFRSADSVERWLELHYSALTEALTFVENRVAARVHISKLDTSELPDAGGDDDRRGRRGAVAPPPIDVAAVAAECLRVLRGAAVATLPLRADKSAGTVLSAAFLVEQELWKQFIAEVDAQAKVALGVRIELTGPWAAYDFVQMQLGA